MHLLTWTELQRLRVNGEWPITRMTSEQTVLLHAAHSLKEGKFDFLVETPRKTIGFEVLTRPSKGKMLKKFVYRNEVDQFVFVIPHDALLPYQRTEKNHGWKVRPRYLPASFGEKGLYTWLVDLDTQAIVAKQPFSKLYYVEAEKSNGKAKKGSGKRRL
jgi:hypothetical protein